MSADPKPTSAESNANLSEEERVWWKTYTASLTPEDHEEMRSVTDADVLAKIRAHLARMKDAETKKAHDKARGPL